MASRLPDEIKLMIFEEYTNLFIDKMLFIAENRNQLVDALKPLFVSRSIWKLADRIFAFAALSGKLMKYGNPHLPSFEFHGPTAPVRAKVQHYEHQIAERPEQIDGVRVYGIIREIRELGQYYSNLQMIHIKFTYTSTKPQLLHWDPHAPLEITQHGHGIPGRMIMREVVRELHRGFAYPAAEKGNKVGMYVTDDIASSRTRMLYSEFLGDDLLRGHCFSISFDDHLDAHWNLCRVRMSRLGCGLAVMGNMMSVRNQTSDVNQRPHQNGVHIGRW